MRTLLSAVLTAVILITGTSALAASDRPVQLAQSGQQSQVVEFGQWLGELQSAYRTASQAMVALDRAEILVDDYLYQEVSETVMRREVGAALSESRALLDTSRGQLRDLPSIPANPGSKFGRIGSAARDSVGNMIASLQQHAELVEEMRAAALRGNIDRYDALSARSMRLLSSMLEAENSLISLILATMDGNSPQRGLNKSILALNRALIEMSDASAEIYAGTGTQTSYARSVRNMRPHIDSAREAIREGRDTIEVLYRMAERVGPRKAEAARKIAGTYRSSFRIETQLVRLVEDYTSVLADLARRPDTVSDSRINEAIEIFSSKLPGLTERRMALNEKRRRLIVDAFRR